MLNKTLTAVLLITATGAFANETQINGTVQSKCSIYTDVQGVYGAPLPNKLSTDPVDGGVTPKIRYDVAQAGYYLAKITHPNAFTSSPTLQDAVAWTGATSVAEVSDVGMSAYESSKVLYNNVTEFDLTLAGTTWFQVDSTAMYGYDKSFPAGNYTAVVTAECIAK